MCVRLWGYHQRCYLKMCNWQHVFLSCLPSLHSIYRVWLQGPRRPGNLLSVHHSTQILSYLYSPCLASRSFVIYSSPALLCCTNRKYGLGSWLSWYNIATRESGPTFRSLETMRKSGCCSAAVIPMLTTERGQRQGNPEIQLTRQSR